MQIDPNAPADKPETAEMVVIHKAFRREFGLLPGVVADVAAGDTARAGQVADHADLMFAMLHEHHDSEDRLLWPLLHERAALQNELIDTMEQQHQVVADLIALITGELTAWRTDADPAGRDRIAGNLKLLHDALDEHLALEEKAILPLIHEHLTLAEWKAPQKAAAAGLPSGFRPRMLLTGVVLEDATPRERVWFLHEIPAPARPLWRLIGTRMYATHQRTIRRTERSSAG